MFNLPKNKLFYFSSTYDIKLLEHLEQKCAVGLYIYFLVQGSGLYYFTHLYIYIYIYIYINMHVLSEEKIYVCDCRDSLT